MSNTESNTAPLPHFTRLYVVVTTVTKGLTITLKSFNKQIFVTMFHFSLFNPLFKVKLQLIEGNYAKKLIKFLSQDTEGLWEAQ